MQAGSDTPYKLMSQDESDCPAVGPANMQLAVSPPDVPPPATVKMSQGAQLLGPKSTLTTCPYCNTSIYTTIKFTTTTRTHITAALCCTICCMCCIPYCCDSARNTDHYCPSCTRFIGTYEK